MYVLIVVGVGFVLVFWDLCAILSFLCVGGVSVIQYHLHLVQCTSGSLVASRVLCPPWPPSWVLLVWYVI